MNSADLYPLPGGDRALELRSGIFLEYPKAKIGDTNLITFIPFYENPIISERKSARLVEYNPLNRGSALFSHVGADARSINIEFMLSLAHIKSSWNRILNTRQAFSNLQKEDRDKSRFFKRIFVNSLSDDKKDFEDYLIDNYGEYEMLREERYFKLTTYEQGVVDDFESTPKPKTSKQTILDSITFILGLIRTCVAGSAENSILGPPTLRLRHGLSYQDVPLLCKDYSIKVVEEAGYDVETLLPLRIKISLSTVENRTGDFGKFEPGKAVVRDNLAGWEAVIREDNNNSTDPGRIQ